MDPFLTLLHADPNSIDSLCSVNKDFYDICQRDDFWVQKIKLDFPQFNLTYDRQSFNLHDLYRIYRYFLKISRRAHLVGKRSTQEIIAYVITRLLEQRNTAKRPVQEILLWLLFNETDAVIEYFKDINNFKKIAMQDYSEFLDHLLATDPSLTNNLMLTGIRKWHLPLIRKYFSYNSSIQSRLLVPYLKYDLTILDPYLEQDLSDTDVINILYSIAEDSDLDNKIAKETARRFLNKLGINKEDLANEINRYAIVGKKIEELFE